MTAVHVKGHLKTAPDFIKEEHRKDFVMNTEGTVTIDENGRKLNSEKEEILGVVSNLDKIGAKAKATEQNLRGYWRDRAEEDANALIPKAVEYGAADLKVMGEAMACLFNAARRGAGLEEMAGDELRTVGLEMATTFYQLGKVARQFGAYERGVLPSQDTLDDNGVYSFMTRKIRATGFWV